MTSGWRHFLAAVSAISTFAACSGGGGNGVVVTPPPPSPPPPAVTPMYDIQGPGSVSPLVGQNVTVAGIVTGDFQQGDADSRSELSGFFLQEESPDADMATSDGVFVFDGPTPSVDVSAGDRVTVAGSVREQFGETQISASSVTVTGAGAIAATDLVLPAAAAILNGDGVPIADLERYEGMLVRVPQPMSVTDLFDLERYGEVELSANGRLQQFTSANSPDVTAYAAHVLQNARRRLRLDDGSSAQNVSPVRYLVPDPVGSPGHSLRVGDSSSGLTGNIRFSRGSGGSGFQAYRLVPTTDPQFVSDNPRPAAPPDPGGSLTVASFNVLNFFTTIDTGQAICGPSGNGGCRGADSSEEFDRQRAKIVNALIMLDADVVGLNELENNPTAALQSIVDGMNAITGGWDYVDTGTLGSGVIRNGFIYNTATVATSGAAAVLDSTVDPRFLDNKNRPSLAQSFRQISNNGLLTVVVNHLKSKAAPCNDVGDPDLRDGQANCSQTRAAAAAALTDWLATDPTSSGDADFLVIGDMNAYLQEDAIGVMEAAGYANLLGTLVGTDAYSFVFEGDAGALDHAFASPNLLSQVSGILEWHINADEPPVLDYNLESGRDPALFDGATLWRASDHDPVVIGLTLDPD